MFAIQGKLEDSECTQCLVLIKPSQDLVGTREDLAGPQSNGPAGMVAVSCGHPASADPACENRFQ